MLISMDINIDRNLSSNESVVLIPQLGDSLGNLVELPAIYINGRNQQLMSLRERVNRQRGVVCLKRKNDTHQHHHYLHSLPYLPWMKNAKLEVIEKECGCGVPIKEQTDYLTSFKMKEPYRPMLSFITPEVEAVKLRQEKGSAYVDYPLNEIEIYPDFHNNKVELGKIESTIDLVKKDTNVVITGITIHGYASPEGPYKKNVFLAEGRAKSVKDFVRKQMMLSDSIFSVTSTPEDWDGFRDMIAASNLKYKDALLNIIDKNKDKDRREYRLRKYSAKAYELFKADYFPYLRRVEYEVNYVVRPFTVDQAEQVFYQNPKNLSIEEMFRIAQKYEEGSDAYNRVFMTAVLLYPNDPVANFNAACIALKKNDIPMAERFLAKSPESAEKMLAEGVLFMLKKDYVKAREKFEKAQQAGLPLATENLNYLETIY